MIQVQEQVETTEDPFNMDLGKVDNDMDMGLDMPKMDLGIDF